MSRGPGATQRAIIDLMTAHSDCAWRVEDICRVVYGVDDVEKRHRVAVIRAINKMTLPEGWVFEKAGSLMQEHLILYRPDDENSYLCYRVLPMPGKNNKPINVLDWRKLFAAEITAIKKEEAEIAAEKARFEALTPKEQAKERLASEMSQLSVLMDMARTIGMIGGDRVGMQNDINACRQRIVELEAAI